MNKKIFILPLLVLVLMVGFSFSAFAEDTGIGLRVGNDEITKGTSQGTGWSYTDNGDVPTLTITGNVTLSNVDSTVPVGIVVVVDGEYTVTLNNVNLKYVVNKVVEGEKYTSGSIIYFKDGGKLNLAKGTTNRLADDPENTADEEDDAITFGGNLEVSGGGRLDIDTSCGIYSPSAASLTIADSVIDITAGYYGMLTKGNVSISGSEVKITSSDYNGIYANQGDVSISSGSEVTITSGDDGIYAYEDDEANQGNVSISDSEVNITSGDEGIRAYNDVSISGSKVTIESGDGGIYADVGEVSISGSEVTITSGGFGIFAYEGEVSISDSEVKIKSGLNGIVAYEASQGEVSISGSEVTIESYYHGIYAREGEMSISGSEVTITSDHHGIYASGNVSISDSNLIVRSVYPPIFSEVNITIKGKSELDLKAVVPVPEEGGATSGLSADEGTEGPDMPLCSYFGVITVAAGNISFEGPVQVTADGSESRYPSYGIAVGNGNIEFKLTPGGFVKGIGSNDMTGEESPEENFPAQGGIVILAASADGLGKITLNEGNVITAPQGSTVVSGRWIEDDDSTGAYQAIGTSEAVAQEAVVEYPTYDHMGYMEGYPEGDFRPAANLTRGECAMLFSRFSEDFDNTKTYPASFTDVKAGSWYANCIGYMEDNDIIKGYEDKTFRPDTPITRAEFVALADRYFGLKITSGTLSFADVPQGHWAYDYIYTAQAENLIKGYSAELFGTDDYIKRGDVVLIINRALECDPDTVFIDANVKDMNTFTDVVKGETTDEYYYNILAAANSHRFYNNTEGKIKWLELIK